MRLHVQLAYFLHQCNGILRKGILIIYTDDRKKLFNSNTDFFKISLAHSDQIYIGKNGTSVVIQYVIDDLKTLEFFVIFVKFLLAVSVYCITSGQKCTARSCLTNELIN